MKTQSPKLKMQEKPQAPNSKCFWDERIARVWVVDVLSFLGALNFEPEPFAL